jgi:hypothetical protein
VPHPSASQPPTATLAPSGTELRLRLDGATPEQARASFARLGQFLALHGDREFACLGTHVLATLVPAGLPPLACVFCDLDRKRGRPTCFGGPDRSTSEDGRAVRD